MVKELITDTEELIKSCVWDPKKKDQDFIIQYTQDLINTLDTLEDRSFICSNEIGYLERAIAVKAGDEQYIFCNPYVQKNDHCMFAREIDIYNGKEYFVPRFTEIDMSYMDTLGAVKACKFKDDAAILMGRALDLLDGITAESYGLEILEGFDDLTEAEKDEVMQMYASFLKEERYALRDNLLANEDTKKLWTNIEYNMAVTNGEIELEDMPEEMSNTQRKRMRRHLKELLGKVNANKYWNKLSKRNKND